MKVVTVVGARPQFVKAAALSRAFQSIGGIEEIIVHTGQHFDANMSDIFFEEMEIPKPGYNLDINSLGHGAMTGRMLEGIEEILLKENPDVLLVFGDTNSTLAGALAAKKIHIKVAHVEAGLRSFNMRMPEEVNRILTDRISDFLYCPTSTAVSNLDKEGYSFIDNKVVQCGDVMQDAAMFYALKSADRSNVIETIGKEDFILATLHRAENTDSPENLKNIINAMNHMAEEHGVVLPLHPRTKKIIENQGLQLNATIIDPVGYFDMIELIKHSKLVMTDSGGLQKEAFFFEKNCVTMRDQTEWVELLDNGVNVLTGADQTSIEDAVAAMLNTTSDFTVDLYGQGKATQKIAQHLREAIG